MAYTVMIDAGHGGKDPGAVYQERREKDDTLKLAMAVGQILQENGIRVEYTRTTDVYETPYEKAMEANNAGVDFFVSIHRNSYPQANAVSGVEVLVYDKSGLKNEMAEEIADCRICKSGSERTPESRSSSQNENAGNSCGSRIYQFRYR